MMLFYRLLFLPGLILVLPYYLFRMWRRGGYRKGFGNRFGSMGHVPRKREKVRRIWIQAVSVGELMAIRPLLEALSKDPSVEVVLTTTTSTGYRVLEDKLSNLTVWHGIFPLDFWLFSRMAWQQLQPDIAVLMEGELWPEHIHQANRRHLPAILINARLSDRSYRRHHSFSHFTRHYFKGLAGIFAGSESDGNRFKDLGWLTPETIHVPGNLKLDIDPGMPPSNEERSNFLVQMGFPADTSAILLGSSTWSGEEIALVQTYMALRQDHPGLRLLIVPRHAERKNELETMLRPMDVSYHFRSSGHQAPSGTEVYMADTTGELGMLSHYADLVFIGKSLPPHTGGQTPVESAALGKPMIFGPDMSNFRDIARNLLAATAAQRITCAEEMPATVRQLLEDPALRQSMGRNAATFIGQNRGATGRVQAVIMDHLA